MPPLHMFAAPLALCPMPQFTQVLPLLDPYNEPLQFFTAKISAPHLLFLPQFTQVLPLLDPDNDPSLKTRGAFPAKVPQGSGRGGRVVAVLLLPLFS